MDKFERLIIRSYADWKAVIKNGGLRLRCPGCGETRPHGFEVHHIAGEKYGEESMPLCVICHRELEAWVEQTNPQPMAAPPSKTEKWGHFLIGLYYLREMQDDLLFQIGEALIQAGRSGVNIVEE